MSSTDSIVVVAVLDGIAEVATTKLKIEAKYQIHSIIT